MRGVLAGFKCKCQGWVMHFINGETHRSKGHQLPISNFYEFENLNSVKARSSQSSDRNTLNTPGNTPEQPSVVCQQETARMGGWKDTVPCVANLITSKNEQMGKLVY